MPRQDRKPATRRRIVAAALAEFAEHGFERARMEGVAQRAGVAHGTVYVHFSSKPQLFRAVVEHVADDFFGVVAGFADAPGATFMDVVDGQLAYLKERPEVDAVLSSLRGVDSVGEVREGTRIVDGRLVELWRRWIARAAPGPVSANLARLVSAAVTGVLAARFTDADLDVHAVLAEFGPLVETGLSASLANGR